MTARMTNPENIEKHKWQKGQSGNPAGGKKGKTLTTLLRAKMEGDSHIEFKNAIVTGGDGVIGSKVNVKVKIPTQEMLINSVLKQAVKGNSKAMDLVWERMEGKVEQPIRHIEDVDVNISYWDIHGEDGQEPEKDNDESNTEQ